MRSEFAIALIDIAGEELGAVGVGTRDDDGRNAHDIGGKTGGDKLLNGFEGWDKNFAAHVPALLCGRQLIFEVDAGRSGFDHGLHQFVGV